MSANFYKDNFQDESLMHNTMTMSGTQHFYCCYLTKVRTGILKLHNVYGSISER